MSTEASLIRWAMRVRSSPRQAALRAVLTRASVPEHRAAALRLDPVQVRLSHFEPHEQLGVLLCLSFIMANPRVRHDADVSVSAALGEVGGGVTAAEAAVGSDVEDAARVLGNVLARAGAVNLVTYVRLLRGWARMDMLGRAMLIAPTQAGTAT